MSHHREIVYTSNAKWEKIPDSKDEHKTYEDAKAIADLLLERYGKFGEHCEIRGTCLKTWVKREIVE